MKILIYHFLDDPRFKSLTSTLNVLQGCSIGTCSSDTTEGEVKAFDPQLIVHNHPKEKELFGRNSIAINDDGYSLKSLKPFISLQQKREINPVYKSDVVFIGNPVDIFGPCIFHAIQSHRINTKFFHHEPLQYRGYVGYCDPSRYHDAYAQSKASIVPSADDTYRLLDIVYAGGNPVLYTTDEQFEEDVKSAVLDNKKFTYKMSKADIFAGETNFDRMSEILSDFGLQSFSSHLVDFKNNGEFL